MDRHLRCLLVILLAATVLATAAPAEILDLSRNRGGFFAGVNFAKQGGDMDRIANDLANEMQLEFGGNWSASTGTNTGFGLGGYYVFQTSPTFGIELEGQYIRRGVKITLEASGVSGIPSGTDLEAQFQMNYLEIPVLARFSPSPAARTRVVLLAGPVIGFLTSANLKMTVADQSQSQSVSEGYEDVNFGLLGGVGISAQVGTNSHLVLQARYFLGLTNPIAQDEFEAKSGDFGIFAGMEFTVK